MTSGIAFVLAYVIGIQGSLNSFTSMALVGACLSGLLLSWFASNAFYFTLASNYKLDCNLSQAIQQSENASQAKSEFLANISHEIRTPLHGVVGLASSMDPSSLPAEQKELIHTIHSSSCHLLQLLNDILDYAKIEADKLTLKKKPIDLEQILEKSINPAQQWREMEGNHLHISVQNQIRETLVGDPEWIQKIFQHLIRNAVQYTPTGTISLVIRYERLSAGSVLLHCSVADTGTGMKLECVENFLKPFQQAELAKHHENHGAGLGLAITKSIVEAMHGGLCIDSKINHGTQVSFSLLLAVADIETNNTEGRPPVEKACLKGAKVLLVDDNKINRILAEKSLDLLETSYTSVASANRALEEIGKQDFDFIFMDVRMPGMNGFEAVRLIRQMSGKKSKTPIVMLSASGDPEDLLQAKEAGANDFLTKPFTMEDLRQSMARWLSRQLLNQTNSVAANPRGD
ncbi:MAG: response regulator [Planctomycetes bacterium]|nr:response regulator [Planctomycetota bacterium]